MIQDKKVAQQISDLMLKVQAEINDSIFLVKDNCSKEEFEAYRKAGARVLADILLDILNPIYAKHPALKPKGLDDEDE
jgi:hypothetical protein